MVPSWEVEVRMMSPDAASAPLLALGRDTSKRKGQSVSTFIDRTRRLETSSYPRWPRRSGSLLSQGGSSSATVSLKRVSLPEEQRAEPEAENASCRSDVCASEDRPARARPMLGSRRSKVRRPKIVGKAIDADAHEGSPTRLPGSELRWSAARPGRPVVAS